MYDALVETLRERSEVFLSATDASIRASAKRLFVAETEPTGRLSNYAGTLESAVHHTFEVETPDGIRFRESDALVAVVVAERGRLEYRVYAADKAEDLRGELDWPSSPTAGQVWPFFTDGSSVHLLREESGWTIYRWVPGETAQPRLALEDLGVTLRGALSGFARFGVYGDDAVIAEDDRILHVRLGAKSVTPVIDAPYAMFCRSAGGVVYRTPAGQLTRYAMADGAELDLSKIQRSDASKITETHADRHLGVLAMACTARELVYTNEWGVFAIDFAGKVLRPVYLTPDLSDASGGLPDEWDREELEEVAVLDDGIVFVSSRPCHHSKMQAASCGQPSILRIRRE